LSIGELRHDTVQLSRGRMHYVSVGTGPGAVLLHGWPGFWFDHRHVLPRVASGVRAVAPDFFGFGESVIDDAAAEAGGEQAHAADVVELLDALGLDRAVLVGQDIGSAVAPAVARIAPERVGGLVLLNPTHPYIGDKRNTPDQQREAWYQHFHLLELATQMIDGDRRLVDLYLSYFYEHWAGRKKIAPVELARVVEVYAKPGAFAASIGWYRARATERARRRPVAPVHVPTIALWGDRDPMRPLDHRDGFERAFPASTIRVLSGVGHFVAAEAPEAVADAIAELASRD
jgi:pimeloyl-ACP methyl ester carboxylesterase